MASSCKFRCKVSKLCRCEVHICPSQFLKLWYLVQHCVSYHHCSDSFVTNFLLANFKFELRVLWFTRITSGLAEGTTSWDVADNCCLPFLKLLWCWDCQCTRFQRVVVTWNHISLLLTFTAETFHFNATQSPSNQLQRAKFEVLTVVLLRMQVVWNVMLCWMSSFWWFRETVTSFSGIRQFRKKVLNCMTSDDEDTTVLWNVRNVSCIATASHPRRLNSYFCRWVERRSPVE